MKKIQIEVSGVSPLLLHRFTDEAAIRASEGHSSAIRSNGKLAPREQAELALYADDKGRPIIPAQNLLRCLVDAGKFFKVGKTKITTARTSLVPAAVFVGEVEVPIKHEHPWDVCSLPIVNPSTGGRMLSHRPRFNDWKLQFSLDVDEDIFSPALIREIVDCAGKRIGIGSFRPDRKGPFGRFKVTSWKEEKN